MGVEGKGGKERIGERNSYHFPLFGYFKKVSRGKGNRHLFHLFR